MAEYLARYSHRIAISNRRIVNIKGDRVQFTYKDYRDHDRIKVMALEGVEFIRRFLMHVLPKGLMRIRHYGWLANRCRAEKLKRVRAAIDRSAEAVRDPKQEEKISFAGYPCPKCRRGQLRIVASLLPAYRFDTG